MRGAEPDLADDPRQNASFIRRQSPKQFSVNVEHAKNLSSGSAGVRFGVAENRMDTRSRKIETADTGGSIQHLADDRPADPAAADALESGGDSQTGRLPVRCIGLVQKRQTPASRRRAFQHAVLVRERRGDGLRVDRSPRASGR
ncbi:MAG: hypothetical protein MZV70_11035 [Desulfobacterales bacterium]|nr:hypothetical protein [Desulfobacterales bacterium]